MVVIVVRVLVVVMRLYYKGTQCFSVIIQFSSNYPQISDHLQILLLLILRVGEIPILQLKLY